MMTEDDIARRLHSVLPTGWFPASLDDAPKLRAVLAMPANSMLWVLGLIAYARSQMRISTATDGWLDLFAYDFFGTRIRRRPNQSDSAFRTRIKAELLRPRATRRAMRDMLFELTGREPRIFEPARPMDTGAWGGENFAYGLAGGWGSLDLPGQVLIDVYRDTTTGVPSLNGYGGTIGGYGVGRIQWINQEMAADSISDDEILAAMNSNKPEGVIVWTQIHS